MPLDHLMVIHYQDQHMAQTLPIILINSLNGYFQNYHIELFLFCRQIISDEGISISGVGNVNLSNCSFFSPKTDFFCKIHHTLTESEK